MQQSSTNSFCNRRWTVGLVGLIVLCSISAVLYRFGRSFYAEHQVRPLLESAYNIQRPGGGRLFGSPYSPEPLYNLVITYRKLRLSRPADEMLQRYTELDSRSMWYRELTDTRENDESTVLNDLRRAAETNDLRGAERLFDKNPELCRR